MSLAQLLGESAPIAELRGQVGRLLARQGESVRRHAPILILGETGTGKGLLANAIHGAGPRARGPFVDVNCAAIPGTLLEAELFGFERGAFTDAHQAKAGLFQAAHGGTLFLDEVGLLPEGSQAKLLKALEERSVRRLGSTRSEAVDVWLVAATSENLEAAVRARRFREDLYHRLAVVTLRLPPLRERGDDIGRLAEHFLSRACDDYGLAPRTLSADARAALRAYAWPGNVRELANAIERVALLSDGAVVTATTLALPSSSGQPESDREAPRDRQGVIEAAAEAEKSRLLAALREVKWNVSKAAVRLGVPRNTLRYRMDKLGLGPPAAPRRPARAVEPAADEEMARPSAAASETPGSARLRWERRRVTFVRVRFVPADGERASSEISREMDAIVDKVRGFGGQVLELGAMGLVAAFGLDPLEDAPRHAASTAVAIQKVPAGLPAGSAGWPAPTVTLHTALVPVGRHPGGDEVDAEAKRAAIVALETLGARAEPGAIVVSGDAAPFLARRFELRPLGPADAGRVYHLAGPIDVDRGAVTAFVGREAELGLLHERFRQAAAGSGQMVSVVGEPGIGKSRLLREFHRQLGGKATWLEGQATSFGRMIGFHPVIDLVRRTFGIDETDSEDVIVERIERALLEMGEDLRPTLGFVRSLLSIDPGDPAIERLDPQLRRAGIFDAMQRVLSRAAETGPLVIVWEDFHWADQATEEFVTRLADGVVAHRVLMIVTGRTGYSPPAGARAFHTRLALAGLSEAHSGAMARALMSVDELPARLQALLARRAEGNPFFLEELLRSFQETGAVRRAGDGLALVPDLDALVLPGTVQDVILARIERLGPVPRRVLDVAAVIGREFARRVLDRVAEDSGETDRGLGELTAAELTHEQSLFPEVTYRFKHAVTHEVAYDALDPARRAELHRSTGVALEELYPDRLAEHAEVLARHFSRAGSWPKAFAYLLQAAKKAANAFAIREALALYDQALEADQQAGGTAAPMALMEIHRAKSTLYFVMSDFARARAEGEHVVALARQLDDRMREAKALSRIAWADVWQRDLDWALAHARAAIRVAGPIGNEEVLARAHFTIGYVSGATGDLAGARAAIDHAIRSGRLSEAAPYLSLALSVAGHLKSWEGDYAGASQLQTEALELARQHNHLVPLLFGFFFHGLTLSGQGEYARALGLFHEGVTLAERIGDDVIHHSRLLNCLGWLHLELGDLDRAAELSRRSAEMVARGRHDRAHRNAEINLGNICLARGDLREAGELLDGAYHHWEHAAPSRWMQWRYSMRLFDTLGRLSLARGDVTRARTLADRCLEVATRTSSRKNLVKAWRLRGEIALARRDVHDAEDAIRQALAVARAIGNPTQLWKTHAAWGQVCAARDRPDEARDAYRAARDVLERIKAGLTDPVLRTTLERAPGVPEVYGGAGSL